MKNIVWLICFVFMANVYGQTFQINKSDEASITNIISQMTLDEKMEMLGGVNEFDIKGLKRLGIPTIRMADGPCGIRNYGAATAYFAPMGMAATWDTTVMHTFGSMLGREAISKNLQIILAPGMNIYRAPLAGRNFEYLGEDPFLSGKMASAYIKGIQKEGVMAVAKHFACNNQEYNRHNISSDVDERTLHEIYFPAFKRSVQEGGAASVMSAYNLVNGVHASENAYILKDVLKKMWGFDGFVMSDWWSTYSTVDLANNGLDLEMPYAMGFKKQKLLSAINEGLVKEDVIDDKIRRILRAYYRFGFMNEHRPASASFDASAADKSIIESARGGIVLLKNNNILPLDKSKIKKLALVGPYAFVANTGAGGSAYVVPKKSFSIYNAIKELVGNEMEIHTAVGNADTLLLDFFDQSGMDGEGFKCEYFSNRLLQGKPALVKMERHFDLKFDQPLGQGIKLDSLSARFTSTFTAPTTGFYKLGVSGNDGFRVYINEALVFDEVKYLGTETLRNKTIKLAAGEKIKLRIEYRQTQPEQVLRVAIHPEPEDALKDAVDLATNSDAAVVCVGFDRLNEGEGYDRPFGLSPKTVAFIKAIAAVNKKTIVVVNAGGNVGIGEWIDNVPAVLHAWYPGQSGNIALSEILFGITNPSGKLPFTIGKRWEDNPVFNSYFDEDNDKRVSYTEGIFVGYRGYEKNNTPSLFPFGYGMSYTSFKYSKLKISKKSILPHQDLEVTVRIKNTGKVKGKEVVQLYIQDVVSSLPRPIKELKGFNKVELNAGETKTVKFIIKKDDLSYYNPELHDWILEPGAFNILIGSNSKDILLKKKFDVK